MLEDYFKMQRALEEHNKKEREQADAEIARAKKEKEKRDAEFHW